MHSFLAFITFGKCVFFKKNDEVIALSTNIDHSLRSPFP